MDAKTIIAIVLVVFIVGAAVWPPFFLHETGGFSGENSCSTSTKQKFH